jgi:serine/threonine-protein kinase HipA
MTKRELILITLERFGEIRPKELVDFTGINERTVRNHIKKLEEEGLVKTIGSTTERYYKLIEDSDRPKEVIVVLEGQKVGILFYANGQHKFIFDKKYRGKPLPALDLDSENISADLYPEFENLLPENKRRDTLLQEYSELAEILPHLPNPHGAYEFYTAEQHEIVDYSKRPNYIVAKKEILGENSFPNFIDAKIDIPDDILDNDENYSSLSGFQNKIDITFENGKIVRAFDNPDYLLKPINQNWGKYFQRRIPGLPQERDYYPYAALNEHLFMTFAKNELGFDVPYTGIIWDEERKDFHYITKRYDRYQDWKYQQRDFGQILGYTSKNKYAPSSEELFKGIVSHVRDKEALIGFLDFYYYSYVLKHNDLHVKNVSVIDIGNGTYHQSPLYDIISVGIYNGKARELGLSLNDRSKNANFNDAGRKLRLRDFYVLCEILGVSESVFDKRAEMIQKKFKERFPEYIEGIREIEKNIKLKFILSRSKVVPFSERVWNFYERRLIEL